MSRRFQPDAGYEIFLYLLVQTRTDQDVSQEELATRLGLSPAQVAPFESGEKPLHFVQTREWCLALRVSFLEFMIELDAALSTDATLFPDDTKPLSTDADPTDADQNEGGTQ
jgi:transcriptional regulator with XRE-family HTH domain